MSLKSAVSTYAFINAKLRARISSLLDEEFFRSIARARSFVEAVSLVQTTRYASTAETYSRTGDVKLCELELVRTEWETLSGVRKHVPIAAQGLADAMLWWYEVTTVKHAVRLWFEGVVRGRAIDDKVPYLLRDDAAHGVPVDAIINAGTAGEINAALSGRPYADRLGHHLSALAETGTLYPAEIELDRWYYGQLLQAVETLDPRDERVARSLIGVEIDAQNVAWLVRSRRYEKSVRYDEAVLPGGRLIADRDLRAAYGSERPLESVLAAIGARAGAPTHMPDSQGDGRAELRRLVFFQEMLGEILDHEIRKTLGGYPFTVGTFLAYVMLLRHEVQTLISVLNARYYDLPSERIEGLL